ncbi:hypothetical protein NLJ89_g1159 [Agrocybe chaxingu]|uniref:Cytochrome P450 n=1 Tax=Agrocybe chaxingu TaxID=84603 RepID=A0A9W8TEV1_9AGAR|nr:hypothetical protein NLJ89_g1159 [Agrocybe chaxingu]
MATYLTAFYCTLSALAAWSLLRLRRKRFLPLPSGPPGLPLIGNVYDIPHDYAWHTYAEWAEKYGDIIYLNVIGNETILLNSAKAAIEILDKRSSNYSDRPRMVMADELMGWEWDFAHMPYSDFWRRHRRAFHQFFQPRNLASLYPVQMQTTLTLLEQLSKTPDQFVDHIRQYVGSAVLRAAYGYTVKSENDFYIGLAREAVQPLLLVVHAGAYLVEFLPFLKYIPAWPPGAGFKRMAEDSVKSSHSLRDIPFNNVKQEIANGTAESSFVSSNLEKLKNRGALDVTEEEVIKNCAGLVYLAGSDTTASLLLTWMLAMARYPEVQAHAQSEVDAVTRGLRLPDFDDRNSTPYIDAMITETMRWHPVTPMGATVTANTCICPGRYLASNSAWIAIASILSLYTISKFVKEDGTVVEPPIEFTDGLVSHPKPYRIKLVPRGDVNKVIEAAKLENN